MEFAKTLNKTDFLHLRKVHGEPHDSAILLAFHAFWPFVCLRCVFRDTLHAMADCVPYKRHLPPCQETSRSYTRCGCPCYAQGNIVRLDGSIEYINRRSLHTTEMSLAHKIVRTWHNNHTAKPAAKITVLTLETAVEEFLADVPRQIGDQTKDQYTLLLRKRLVPFCTSRQYNETLLTAVTHRTLAAFVNQWPNSQLTNSLNLGRLRKFFKWCELHTHFTVATNPMRLIHPITRGHIQKLPYSPNEMTRILAACEKFPTRVGPATREMITTLVLVQRWCGPRISDALALRWTDFKADGWIDYTAQKNGQHVTMPANPLVLESLKRIPHGDSEYIFHRSRRPLLTAKGKTRSSVKARWWEAFRVLFALADVSNGGSHRFRHTCAVQALLGEIPSEVVALMLGDEVETIIHAYSAKTKERQRHAGTLVAQQWAT